MSTRPWNQKRSQEVATLTSQARRIMNGRTIENVTAQPCGPECDGVNVLVVSFTDGTTARIIGSYGGYTGHSCDEYFERIAVEQVTE